LTNENKRYNKITKSTTVDIIINLYTMTQLELIRTLSKDSWLKHKEVISLLNNLRNIYLNELKENKVVSLLWLWKLKLITTKERKWYNLRTKEAITIKSSNRVKFKANAFTVNKFN